MMKITFLKSGYLFYYCQLSFHLMLCIACSILLPACNSTYTSKKKGYYKIDFPERGYTSFQKEGFPYSFEYPVYAQVVKDSTYFDQDLQNPYWINIDFPQFGARIFLSSRNARI